MAKKKKFKDRVAEAEQAAAEAAVKAAAKKANEPEVEEAPETPQSAKKVKRPRYVRPPRTSSPPAPKPATTSEPRMVRFASRTLTLAAAKLLAKDTPAKPESEDRYGR